MICRSLQHTLKQCHNNLTRENIIFKDEKRKHVLPLQPPREKRKNYLQRQMISLRISLTGKISQR